MTLQGFYIGDRDWYVMCYYGIVTERNFDDAFVGLITAGCPERKAREAIDELHYLNSGYTFTSYGKKLTAILVGRATDSEQFYNTVQHELKHATEHISEYYGVDSGGETAAYLQGELARNMYRAVMIEMENN